MYARGTIARWHTGRTLRQLNGLTAAELTELRATAEAAVEQLRTGPREWPGRPSAQRLAFFLSASPEKILRLLNMLDASP